jgi:hypothetical protein
LSKNPKQRWVQQLVYNKIEELGQAIKANIFLSDGIPHRIDVHRDSCGFTDRIMVNLVLLLILATINASAQSVSLADFIFQV